MSNNSASSVSPATSPSPPLLNHGYRQQFNNWLQSQGWEDRFTWDKSQKSGPDNQPIWTVVGRFDGSVYGRGRGGKVTAAQEEAARIAFLRLLREEEVAPIASRRLLRRLLWEEVAPLVQRRLEQAAPSS